MLDNLSCPICGGACSLLDTVDFNRTCEDGRGRVLEPSGVAVDYVMCHGCGFSFAPEFARWTPDDFAERIYNAKYALIDPDYQDKRPRANAAVLLSMFGDSVRGIRHLDYGGGNGVMSAVLREAGWKSVSYDPFGAGHVTISELGSFQLVTAFEVFEHVADVRRLMEDLRGLLATDGMILFSTMLSDGHIAFNERLAWWYATPRNGHISLFSRESLGRLGQQYGWNFGSLSEGTHIFCASLPSWAEGAFS